MVIECREVPEPYLTWVQYARYAEAILKHPRYATLLNSSIYQQYLYSYFNVPVNIKIHYLYALFKQ